MGFTATPPIPDYDGAGSAKVLFQRSLEGSASRVTHVQPSG
jgi:hypothetical protein